MTPRPLLETARLRLRPFEASDAPRVRELAGAYEVALNTLTVPHPCPEGAAEEWIASHAEMAASGKGYPTAITLRETGEVVGAVGLHDSGGERELELGYWVGVPYWGQGFASEASRGLIGWGFDHLPIDRVHAHHFARNPASGAVLRKAGMRFVGTVEAAVEKWGEMQDVDQYEIVREQWAADGGGR